MAFQTKGASRCPFIGAALLLAFLAFGCYWTYLSNDAAAIHRENWLDHIAHPQQPLDSAPSGLPAAGVSDADVEEDRQGLRSLLFPEQHIYRQARTVKLQWDVTTDIVAPDGVNQTVYLINGLFPGPTIEARSGDELEIEVSNHASNGEGISVHWHGLAMPNANAMDGVVGVTQCAIGVGETFTYRFRISDEQHGTFWYHAHSGVQQADGLFGGIVVHKPVDATTEVKKDYDVEQILLVGDWYHSKAQEILDWFQDFQYFGNDPAPDSLLFNGRGYFACSMAVPLRDVNCSAIQKPAMTIYGQRTRLRVVNVGALTGIGLTIPNATMRVTEIDGGNAVAGAPTTESVSILYPGERMDLLVEQPAMGRADKFYIGLDRENLKFKNFALTPTQSFPLVWKGYGPERSPSAKTADVAEHFDLAEAVGVVEQEGGVPQTVSEKAVVYTKVEILASHGNSPLGVVNRTSWLSYDPKDTPLLALDRPQWPHMRRPDSRMGDVVRDVPIYLHTGEDIWMDLVINNLDATGHPFHLHGFSFYVVSTWKSPSGYGAYNPFETATSPPGGPMNTATPVRKDTVYVPRMGYVVLRFPLNNAGLWMLHCHTLWHHAAGMGMVLQIGPDAPPEVKQQAMQMCTT